MRKVCKFLLETFPERNRWGDLDENLRVTLIWPKIKAVIFM
jgi:hypothetical protein